MDNPAGWHEYQGKIERVEQYPESFAITYDGGWTFGVDKSELDGLVPEVGQDLIVYTEGFSHIRGVVINGKVIRYQSREDAESERLKWLADYEAKKLARYNEQKDEWQRQVNELHPVLQKRIRRFEAEKGERQFWLEDGGYELYALRGANALIKAAEDVAPGNVGEQIDFIKNWWNLNTAEGGYDYKRQMEMIPEFGEDHSGNTAGAAYSFALAILRGEYTE